MSPKRHFWHGEEGGTPVKTVSHEPPPGPEAQSEAVHKRPSPGGGEASQPHSQQPPRMEGYPRRALLMLSVVVAATALLPSGQEAVSYEEAVALAVNLYNQESGEASAFRLLEAKPQPEWDPRSPEKQVVRFSVQETTCSASEWLSPETCDFKEDGVVKECSGTVFAQDTAPEIHCETPRQERVRVRRNIFNRFIKKVKDKTRKFVKNTKNKLQSFRPGGYTLIGHAGGVNRFGGRRWA